MSFLNYGYDASGHQGDVSNAATVDPLNSDWNALEAAFAARFGPIKVKLPKQEKKRRPKRQKQRK